MSGLLKIAISSALSCDWQKAISANLDLLKENKNDINSLNRLAHAYTQTGKSEEAKKLYKKILALDKYNIIALKNIERLAALPKNSKSGLKQGNTTFPLSPSLFIEEPGKTKTISLKNLAPASILSQLTPGNPVLFFPKKHSVDIRTQNKVYIGTLPDDFAFRLLRFLKAGYEYTTYIKCAGKNNVSVFIREIKRAKRFQSQPSFIVNPNTPIRNIFHDHKNAVSDVEDEEENEKNQEESEE